MWSFRCDLRHTRRVFLLVWPSSDQSCFALMWPFGFGLRHTSHIFPDIRIFSQFDLPYITRLLSWGDLWWPVTLWMWPPSCRGVFALRQISCVFSRRDLFLFDLGHRSVVLMWLFRFNLHDTNRILWHVLLVVWTASYHSPFVLVWPFRSDLHQVCGVFVLRSVVFCSDVTFLIRPVLYMSSFCPLLD